MPCWWFWWHGDGTWDKSMSSGKGKRPKSPKPNPCLSHECVFPFLFVLGFLDSISKTPNGLKVPLTAPTMAKCSGTIMSPRNGFALSSLCFSVSPRVGFLQLHRQIDADNHHHSAEVIHTVQAVRSRLWWLFPSAIFCGFLELVGWSARLWSSHSPYLETPFIMQ
jgi:hypothetical protein